MDTSTKENVYCAITEQGDLGLGAEVLNEADQSIMRENEKKDQKSE